MIFLGLNDYKTKDEIFVSCIDKVETKISGGH